MCFSYWKILCNMMVRIFFPISPGSRLSFPTSGRLAPPPPPPPPTTKVKEAPTYGILRYLTSRLPFSLLTKSAQTVERTRSVSTCDEAQSTGRGSLHHWGRSLTGSTNKLTRSMDRSLSTNRAYDKLNSS